MASLKVLFIGGSGVISSASSQLAVERGIDLYVLNRGETSLRPLPPEATVLHADVRDQESVRAALGDREFDAVVDWVAFTPEHVRSDIELFRGRTGQYVFISSASAYQTPPARLPVTESTPLRNPYWQYSRDKIACEDLLTEAYREEGFPATVVRPSHTYDKTLIPFDGKWTALARMRAGKEIVVHGDGTSLWTLTHHVDFARSRFERHPAQDLETGDSRMEVIDIEDTHFHHPRSPPRTSRLPARPLRSSDSRPQGLISPPR